MDRPPRVYPFFHCWTLGCIYFVVILAGAALNIHLQVFVWPDVFISLGCGIPGSHGMELNKDHPNKNGQRLFIQSLLQQGSQPLSFAFGRDSVASRNVGKLFSEKKRRWLSAMSHWRLVTWRSCGQLTRSRHL